MADSPFGNFGIGSFSPLASMVQGGPSQFMQQYSPLAMMIKHPDYLKYLSPIYSMASGGPKDFLQHYSLPAMLAGGFGGGGGKGGGGGFGGLLG